MRIKAKHSRGWSKCMFPKPESAIEAVLQALDYGFMDSKPRMIEELSTVRHVSSEFSLHSKNLKNNLSESDSISLEKECNNEYLPHNAPLVPWRRSEQSLQRIRKSPSLLSGSNHLDN